MREVNLQTGFEPLASATITNYYFVGSVGRNASCMATQLLWLVLPRPERLPAVIDDAPTKRYSMKDKHRDHTNLTRRHLVITSCRQHRCCGRPIVSLRHLL